MIRLTAPKQRLAKSSSCVIEQVSAVIRLPAPKQHLGSTIATGKRSVLGVLTSRAKGATSNRMRSLALVLGLVTLVKTPAKDPVKGQPLGS